MTLSIFLPCAIPLLFPRYKFAPARRDLSGSTKGAV
jgi:hypothetical protein